MSPGNEARLARRRAEREIAAKLADKRVQRRTERWLNAIVEDGCDWKEAARQERIPVARAKMMLGHPRIARELRRRAEALREREAALNPYVVSRIRNMGIEPGATAADRRNSLQAAAMLEPGYGQAGPTVNVGVSVGIHGYVIDLSDNPSAEPAIPREPAGVRVIDHDAVVPVDPPVTAALPPIAPPQEAQNGFRGPSRMSSEPPAPGTPWVRPRSNRRLPA